MKLKVSWMIHLVMLLTALYAVSYSVCIFSLIVLFDGFDTFSLAAVSGIFSLCLFGCGGYFASKRIALPRLPTLTAFILLCTALPAALIWCAETLGSNIGWMLDLPHRFTAFMMFNTLFDSPKSAFEISVLQPLAVAFSHCAMMVCFSLGIYWGKK